MNYTIKIDWLPAICQKGSYFFVENAFFYSKKHFLSGTAIACIKIDNAVFSKRRKR